jgi:putative membrane protein
MKLLADLAVSLVVLSQLGIMLLEIFFWESSLSLRAFKLSSELAKQTTYMAANQGLYNGFLAGGLIWGLLANYEGFLIKVFFLSCLVIAGIFGAVTVNRSILFFQGGPAILALLLVIMAR